MPTVYDNILSTIGKTPLVRLDKTARQEGLNCNLYAKCEFMSGGGSVKVTTLALVDREMLLYDREQVSRRQKATRGTRADAGLRASVGSYCTPHGRGGRSSRYLDPRQECHHRALYVSVLPRVSCRAHIPRRG